MEYNAQLIIDLKRKYSNIYEVKIGSTNVIFRTLTFKEFDDLSILEDYTSSVDSEEEIVKAALLFPDFDTLEAFGAGAISTLAEEIIEESCFFDIAKSRAKLAEKREEATDVRNLMKAFIISSMPAYKIDELDCKTFDELSYLVSISEQILELRFYAQQAAFSENGEPPTLLLIDPEEEKAKEKNRDPIADKLRDALG